MKPWGGGTPQTLGSKAELPDLCFEYWVRTSNLTGASATLALYCCQVHNFMQMLETKLILSLKTWPQGPTQYMPMGWKQRVLQLLQLYQVRGRGWGGVGGGTGACNRRYSFSTNNCYLRGIPSKRVCPEEVKKDLVRRGRREACLHVCMTTAHG